MADDDRQMPTTNQPLNAERRKLAGPLLMTIGILLLVAVIYLIGLYVRYHT